MKIKITRTTTLLLLVVLALSLLAACSGISKPKLLKYTNNEFGYSISYPDDWRVEVADKGKTCLLTHTALYTTGTIRIDVIPSVPVERAAQSWEMAMATQWRELTRYENKRTQGQWDWYLSYGWVTDEGLEFQGEAYFKHTPNYIYKVDTAARAREYDQYPFNTIIASFKLLERNN